MINAFAYVDRTCADDELTVVLSVEWKNMNVTERDQKMGTKWD